MLGQYCILIHYHELGLKKNNRAWFERVFRKNIQTQLSELPVKNVNTYASRVFVFGIDQNLWNKYKIKLKSVMGLKNAILMYKVNSKLEYLEQVSKFLVEKKEFNSFRVTTKRQDKGFKYTSKDVNKLVGASVQKKFKKSVSLKNPDINILIEIVRGQSYVGIEKVQGYGGLPNNTGETAVSLLSSGIDSPVASFQILKRGVNLVYAHFHSAPATNKQSINNCKKLVDTLSQFQPSSILYIYPLLDLQRLIMDKAPDKLWVILFRRAMVKISCLLAEEIDAKALITGENVGQVSSQTLSNIHSVSSVSNIPIIRPLAGHNKEEIINKAKLINTYEDSIAPHQDCCAFFTPIHPELKSNIQNLEYIESKLKADKILEDIINNREVYKT